MDRDPALTVHDLGWHVGIVAKDSKAPIHKGFPDRWLDADEIGWYRRKGFNWGFILDAVMSASGGMNGTNGGTANSASGTPLMVADKDQWRRDADLFVRRMGLFYSPVAVKTARGTHYYARVPAGVQARTRLNFRGMGLDLLVGPNRIAIGPGSVVNGFRYELVGGKTLVNPIALPVIRDALASILTEHKETRTRMESVVVGELPEGRKVESARRALAKRFSIAGQGGDMGLFKAACLLIQFYRLSYPVALHLLMEWNDGPNVQPSWPLDRLEWKLREAERLMK